MKITIQKFAEGKEFQGKNGPLAIVTVLGNDDKKYKVWRSDWTKTFKEGMDLECNTEVKKDRDGFDEMWLVNPNRGKFVKMNTTIPAYQMAIDVVFKVGEDTTIENIDNWARKFKSRLDGEMTVSSKKEEPKVHKVDMDEEPEVEIPF